MALDQSKIGQLVTEQMEAIERDYGDDEGEHEIGAVITIVQVLTHHGENVASDVRLRHNVGDPIMVLGLMRAAEQTVIRSAGGD
jgi:hypothetical protein